MAFSNSERGRDASLLVSPRLGYSRILGVDISREMIKRAQRLRQILEYASRFSGDGTHDLSSLTTHALRWVCHLWIQTALMQIPGRGGTAQSPTRDPAGGQARWILCFHPRMIAGSAPTKRFWKEENPSLGRRENRTKPSLNLVDKYEETDSAALYVHIPLPDEVRRGSQGNRLEV